MNNVLWFRVLVSAVFLMCIATTAASSAQTFKSLASFDGTNGYYPHDVSPVQGFDGDFYGTTLGYASNAGTIFKIDAKGTLTSLHSFDFFDDGAYPWAGLALGFDGNFYGTTSQSGGNGSGTVFKFTAGGTLTTLYNFCAQTNCTDGSTPQAGLVQATDRNFYGTTYSGGANGYGTIFKITAGGTLTTLYSFNNSDGADPYAGLVQGVDGNFYGTTQYGGAYDYGTVFKITPGGTLTTLHSFDYTDGANPLATLLQASDRNFYGTTEGGGTNGNCPEGCGTVFKVTPTGTLTTVYSFCAQTNCTDGQYPLAGLVQATNGNFYGEAAGVYGINPNYGTVFTITPGGSLTTLHSFDGSDGWLPTGGLVQVTDGSFYGTTQLGGTDGFGTIFSLAVGLSPFVETLPPSGAVGAKVVILGNNLTGTTAVKFDGTAATFTVVSATEIRTTVPTGAKSGKVQVTTPHGTLTSNVVFTVKQ
jgi:uncharacterized repeat protein (TIGR03803 family)